MPGRAMLTLATLVIAVAGCGGVSQQESDAHKVLLEAAGSTAALQSVRLDLKFGPGFQIQGVELVSATGMFKAPADSDLVAKTRTGQGFIEPELLTTGGKVYYKLIQLQAFHELPAADVQQYPNVARLLDKDHGLAAAIAKGRNPTMSGIEQVDGADCYKVNASYGPAELNAALAPVSLSGDVPVALWIDKGNHLVRRIRLTGRLFTAGQDTFAEAHLHDFNGPVDIPSPG